MALPLNLVKLSWHVLLNKKVNMHVSAANAYLNITSSVEFYENAFLAELVHALPLPDEPFTQVLSFWVLVYVIADSCIDFVILVCIIIGPATLFDGMSGLIPWLWLSFFERIFHFPEL